MPESFDPRLDILPSAQQEIWSQLAPASDLSFVLYGGTAVALQLGHRISIDFDFFRTEPLEKRESRQAFALSEMRELSRRTKTPLYWAYRCHPGR
jgi:Nucleotidyl transferase AbiEii toxin, Type IV TA system